MNCVRHRAALALTLLLLVVACEREQRIFETSPDERPTVQASLATELQPVTRNSIGGNPANPRSHAYREENNAQSLADGKRIYVWFNCNGCHAHGGGGMGPALMDEQWIYGSKPEDIYRTIVEGRPNGMPAYGARISEAEIWKLVAYVRSMSGLAPSDAAPSRDDDLAARVPENRTKPSPPREQKP